MSRFLLALSVGSADRDATSRGSGVQEHDAAFSMPMWKSLVLCRNGPWIACPVEKRTHGSFLPNPTFLDT
jgi:hypothetical protein